jgi:hypothetical protein
MSETSDYAQELARKTRRRNMILLAAVVIIVIVIIGFFAYYWITTPPPPEFTANIEPVGPISLSTSQSQLFNSSVTGGVAPYEYQWVLNNLNLTGQKAATYTFPTHSAGTYVVYLNVTDQTGLVAESNNVTITVHT